MILFVNVNFASATIAKFMDIPDLVEGSVQIVEGEVRAVEAQWLSDGSQIFTRVDIAVEQSWLTGALGNSATIWIEGGEVGTTRQVVTGVPSFRCEEKVIVFLWQDSKAMLRLTGLAQGKFRLTPVPPDDEDVPDELENAPWVRNSHSGLLFFDPESGQEDTREHEPLSMTYKDFRAQLEKAIADAAEQSEEEPNPDEPEPKFFSAESRSAQSRAENFSNLFNSPSEFFAVWRLCGVGKFEFLFSASLRVLCVSALRK
ncbi:MAG: hypothetical protein NUW37_12435 [Planctomycetes bacterium]|nr:hypothetical protein [Planctomycetota bacterium]